MTFKEEIEKILWTVFNECNNKDPNFSWETLLDEMSKKITESIGERMPAIELQKKIDQIKAVLES